MKHRKIIKPIPKIYRGIQYRSTLEAKWAVFFDLCGWKYEYEPCNFNGWIPDFVLYDKFNVFVEIKPITCFQREVADKIVLSGCDTDVLLLGSAICPNSMQGVDNVFGWHRQMQEDDNNYWADAWFTFMNDKIGFCNVNGKWNDSLTGDYDDDRSVMLNDTYEEKVLSSWATACNETQWKQVKGLTN